MSRREGMGDIVANAIAVTPEREKRFAFSVPIQTNVTRIVVSGPGFGSFSTLDELAGKEIFVNPLTIVYQELRRLNDSLQSGFRVQMIQLASRGGGRVHKPLASLHRRVRVWTSSVKLRRNLTLQLLGRLGVSVWCTSQQVSPRTQIVTCPLRVRMLLGKCGIAAVPKDAGLALWPSAGASLGGKIVS